VDATLSDGVLRIGPHRRLRRVAVVPLTVQGAVVGALVILKLFEHKADAARGRPRSARPARRARRVRAVRRPRLLATDRKLKTLESLIQLVKRG
jgi:hypothetical protein